jgi:hypothetical protein
MFFEGGGTPNARPGRGARPARRSAASLSACDCGPTGFYSAPTMLSPETVNHIENIKKRAGHLWRFL